MEQRWFWDVRSEGFGLVLAKFRGEIELEQEGEERRWRGGIEWDGAERFFQA